jgi:hypothetical protein
MRNVGRDSEKNQFILSDLQAVYPFLPNPTFD